MSFRDYNYQQSSALPSSGGYDSNYSDARYTATSFSNNEQYSDKSSQQYNNTSQYDCSYTDSYQQPASDTTSSSYYGSSSNDYSMASNSYNQENFTEQSPSSYSSSNQYHTTSSNTSSYQYSTTGNNNQAYSSTLNTGLNEGPSNYSYSDNGNYNADPSVDQYEQTNTSSYAYNQENNSFSNTTYQDQSYSSVPDYTRSDQYTSNVTDSYQTGGDVTGIQNSVSRQYQSSVPQSNDYQTASNSQGYHSNTQLTRGFDNAQSNSGGQHNSYSSGYSSSFNTDTKRRDDTFGGFSYTPKKDFGNFQLSMDNTPSSSDKNRNFSFSGSGSFPDQWGRGRGKFNFSQNRNGRGVTAVIGRNLDDHTPKDYSIPDSGNIRPFSSGPWRGSTRGRGNQAFNNRGGHRGEPPNRVEPPNRLPKRVEPPNRPPNWSEPPNRPPNWSEPPNRMSQRGRKLNNLDNKGFSNRGNQFQPRNHNFVSLGNKNGPKTQVGNYQSNKNDISGVKNTVGIVDSGHSGAYHTNIVVKMKKDEFKAPSHPNEKILNEVEGKKKKVVQEQPQPVAEVKPSADEEAKKVEEEKKTQIAEAEAAKNKQTEQAIQALAPPSKVPETPEEIAREEEIQKKILESIVVVNPENEKTLMSADPVKEIEMSSELRELLKTLTTDHFCKLCPLRMVGPQMATMHYNGKNHLRKVRIFVQTNGRSAGFNMDTLNVNVSPETANSDLKAESEEEKEVDEKKYCKVCKITFLQESQSEMHYKGKNHAKKLRSIANGSEVFECKICCVTVTAQEHLTAHLNGARHKLQIRKMDGDNPHRGGLRGRGGYRGQTGRGGISGSEGNDGQLPLGFRGRGASRGNGRGGFNRGFKRPTDSFNYGGSNDKRPKYIYSS